MKGGDTMLKKTAIFIRIEPEVKELWEAEARKVSRSLSNYVTWAVNTFISEKQAKTEVGP